RPVLDATEMARLFPGRQAITTASLAVADRAMDLAIGHLDAFLNAVTSERSVTAKDQRQATLFLVAAFGVQQTEAALATLKVMKQVLRYWKAHPAEAVFEDTWAGRFGWEAVTSPPAARDEITGFGTFLSA